MRMINYRKHEKIGLIAMFIFIAAAYVLPSYADALGYIGSFRAGQVAAFLLLAAAVGSFLYSVNSHTKLMIQLSKGKK